MPGLRVIRPADANETAAAWKLAIELPGPSALVFSRQNLPVLDQAERIHDGVPRGAYVLVDSVGAPEVILIGTGSEVSLAVEAASTLTNEGIRVRVVSMPSWEVFEAQPASYRESVLPAAVHARVAVEAGVSMGWGRYVGESGAFIGIEHFGASAPGSLLFKEFGITAQAVVDHAQQVLERVRERA